MSEMDQALAHHQAGRFDQAETLCRQILAAAPTHADALHLLGVLSAQNGHPEQGLSLIERAIAANPHVAEYHSNRGQVLRMLGQLQAAIEAYRQAVSLNPADVQVQKILGDVLLESNRSDEAISVYGTAIASGAASPELHNNLAMALQARGRLEGAIDHFRHALTLKQSAEINYNLGNALKRHGDLVGAASAYRRALALRQDFAEAHNNLGATLAQQENISVAIACYEQAVALKPNYVEAYNNLGNALRKAGKLTEAVQAFERALALNPQFADAHNNLGNVLAEQGMLSGAIAAYEKALTLAPSFAQAHSNRAGILMQQSRTTEALSALRQALALESTYSDVHSNLLLCMQYLIDSSPQSLYAEAHRWNAQHAAPLQNSWRPYDNAPDPARCLRLGYVSPDFRAHSVAHFVEPILRTHDRKAFEVFCYANATRSDGTTSRLQSLADHWRNIVHVGDDEAASLIRKDGIDMLIDLSGHTRGHRLLTFARRPAPVQGTYLGFPGTTGVAAIDYRITDALADPPNETDRFHTETLVRLPQGILCYQPAADTPPVGPLPALAAGHVHFGSFNNTTKLNERLITCWAAILRAVPKSNFILKARALADTETGERFRALFSKHGVAAERVRLLAWMPAVEHLGLYNTVDIALDPFPYNGTTTTCEALWMGVPVIALAGRIHAGRVGVSLLTHAGLPELIAQTPEQYIALAVELASDLKRLKALRRRLREQMAASPLCDAKGFTRSLEVAYRQMWKRYCANQDPGGRIQNTS